MGLGHLLQWILRTYHWLHPTFFHSCLEDVCELLKLLLEERDWGKECEFVVIGFLAVDPMTQKVLLQWAP